jgi:hypothetical protein
MANPFAFDKTEGGITLSGPNDCRGSTNLTVSLVRWEVYEARILPTFLIDG